MARRKDHTREQIAAMALDAAREILKTEGIHELSARAIARKISYTVGTLYNVFTDFTDLVLHLNAATMDAMHAAFQPILDDTTLNSHSRIRALTHCYVNFAHTHSDCWSLLFEARFVGSKLPTWYHQKIDHLFKQVETALQPILENTDACMTAAKVLWAALYGICILSINQKLNRVQAGDAYALADSLVDNYLAGFVGSPTLQSALELQTVAHN